MTLIQLNNLSIQRQNKLLLQNLNIKFKAGEIWAVLGQNGVGKTTLLHSISQSFTDYGGHILLNNQDLRTFSSCKRAQKIGLLYQEHNLAWPVNIKDFVLMGRYPYTTKFKGYSRQDRQIAKDAINLLNLQTLQDRTTATISGGEKQRVLVAAMIAQNPDLFLLDEPTNHLDIGQKKHLREIIVNLAHQQNKIIVMVLHDLHFLQSLDCNLLLIKDNGKHLIINNTRSAHELENLLIEL
jgi:iron complex transport system ATP-binding protein